MDFVGGISEPTEDAESRGFFFIRKILGGRMSWNLNKSKQLNYFCLKSICIGIIKNCTVWG